jgi:hypothetical protein
MLFIVVLPLSTPIFDANFALTNAQAASSSACTSTGEVQWGEYVANTTIDTYYNYYDEGFGEDSMGPREESQSNENDDGDGIDENASSHPYPVEDSTYSLRPLTSGFHVSQIHENGSASGIRVNLTTGKTYTFCVTTSAYNSTVDAPIDVYLISSYDWDLYSWSYQLNGNGIDENQFDFSEIPPEWRGPVTWRSFRDAHSYQNVNDVTFSTALDIPQTTGGMFSEELKWQEFRVVIDSWNNGQGGNAPDPKVDISVDITVMVEDRVTIPPWTVSIVCGIALLSLGSIPFILHTRYNKLGREGVVVELLPSLEGNQQSELAKEVVD